MKKDKISTKELVSRLKKIDKAEFEVIINELTKEENSLFKEYLTEILLIIRLENENKIIHQKAERRKKLEQIINDNFDNYNDVFKALA